MNKVILVGNLGADPELRLTNGGAPVATLRVATSQRWNDKNGEKRETTEWHRIIVWGHQAEVLKKHLTKGRLLEIEGRLQTRQWDDRDGVKRYLTEIVAQRVQMLGARPNVPAGSPIDGDEPPASVPEPSEPEPVAVSDEDMPF